MRLNYRNSKTAAATAAYWDKPLDKPEWYSVNALDGENAEIVLYDVIGWPYNEAGELVRVMAGMKDMHILMKINSPGGDYFDGIAIANAVANHPGRVTTRIESLAASIASVIAVSGKTVEAYQNTMGMIHNAWLFAIVDENSALDVADFLKKVDGNILDSYVRKTKIGKKEMKGMMDAETWMTAQEMKDKGFIDTILTSGKPIKAEFDLSFYANLPDELKFEDRELTERDAEKILRDAGFSRHKAKAYLVGCKEADKPIVAPPRPEDNSALVAALQNNIKLIGGN